MLAEAIQRSDERCTFRGGPWNNRKEFVENARNHFEVMSVVPPKPILWTDSLNVQDIMIESRRHIYLRVKMAEKVGYEKYVYWYEFWEQSYHDKRRKKEEKNGTFR